MSSKRARTRSSSLASRPASRSSGSGAMPAAPTTRRLAVEDALRGHRPQAPDQRRHLVGAPLAEALHLLGRLVMAQRFAAHADRDPGRLRALHVDVAGRGVAGLV